MNSFWFIAKYYALNYVKKLFQELIMAVMASNFKVLENEGSSNVNDLVVKNRWKWEWLQVKVGESYLSHCIRKIDWPGYALCIYCNCQINYGTNGKTALKSHVSNSNKNPQFWQNSNKKAYVTNTIIPNSWLDPTVQVRKIREMWTEWSWLFSTIRGCS